MFIICKSTIEINWLRDDDGNPILGAWVLFTRIPWRMRLGIRLHDNCRKIAGVGERVREEGDKQDDEIDAEDAPVKIARDPGDPDHGAPRVSKARTEKDSHRRQNRGDESSKPCFVL